MYRHQCTSWLSAPVAGKLRLGLCCQFVKEQIKFRTTTASSVLRLTREERLAKLSQLCLTNAAALLAAMEFCAASGIGSFRVCSSILPIKTHPVAGYEVEELPDWKAIVAAFRRCGQFAREHDIRTVFHPDQFVVLNSPRPEVVRSSIDELRYQAEVAEWIAADVINIHAGGAYGDKRLALATLISVIELLPDAVRMRLTLENDDKVFTPSDLLPVCRRTGVPFVYDVHHHRCLPDQQSVEAVTEAAMATWKREPLFHVSSPLQGWAGPRPQRHHDFINVRDFPQYWRSLAVTVEVEAKAKEIAVMRLMRTLKRQRKPVP